MYLGFSSHRKHRQWYRQAGSFWDRSRSRPTYENCQASSTEKRKKSVHILWWVLDEADTSFDIGLETLDSFIEELFLIVVGTAENVDGLFSSIGLSKC